MTDSKGFFDSLLQRRLLIITGKGGVGKSTMTCALGLKASQAGYRVLMLGVDSTAQMETYFGMAPMESFKVTRLQDRLHAMNLPQQEIMDEFIRNTLKMKALYDRVLGSKVYQYFTAAAPGFKELMVLSKIHEMEALKFTLNRQPKYDLLLVDAPATGHGLSLFEVPQVAARTLAVGPLVHKAEKLLKLFQNGGNTAVVMVTLAEEMPANEAAELYVRLQDHLKMTVAGLVVNQVYPPASSSLPPETGDSDGDDGLKARLGKVLPPSTPPAVVECLLANARFQQSRSRLNQTYLKLLEERIPVPQVKLEFLPSPTSDFSLLERISNSLEISRHIRPSMDGEGPEDV